MTEYYEPAIETMHRGQLDALQGRLLRRILDHAWASPFYRKLWSGSGIHGPPTDPSALTRLPFTTKQHLLDNYPYGMCAIPRDQLARIHLTSGSSGRPAGILLSRQDIDRHTELGARSLVTRGVRPGDICQITLAYGLWSAGLSSHYYAERLGCMVIPSGPGNTERQIWLMKTLGTTVLTAVPSYMIRIAEVGEGMGIDFESLPIRVGHSAGGRLEDGTRREIERRLGLEMYDCYGMTEVGGIGYECDAHDGLHVWHDQIHLEIVDPRDGEPVAPGERGEIVVTSLCRLALPMIRFRTGDTARLLDDGEACSCGRTHLRISGDVTRLDDAVKVKGVLFSPRAIEHHLNAFPQLSGDFVVEVGPRSRPLLRAELRSRLEADQARELAEAVALELKNGIGLTFEVKIAEHGGLPARRGEKRIHVIPDPGP